jgi:hypothetical protein
VPLEKHLSGGRGIDIALIDAWGFRITNCLHCVRVALGLIANPPRRNGKPTLATLCHEIDVSARGMNEAAPSEIRRAEAGINGPEK